MNQFIAADISHILSIIPIRWGKMLNNSDIVGVFERHFLPFSSHPAFKHKIANTKTNCQHQSSPGLPIVRARSERRGNKERSQSRYGSQMSEPTTGMTCLAIAAAAFAFSVAIFIVISSMIFFFSAANSAVFSSRSLDFSSSFCFRSAIWEAQIVIVQ